ncbi:MAG: Glu-tRNA(Gln) amidotransferase subunit GatD, partial [Candidatus Thorarchaeota archaeon]
MQNKLKGYKGKAKKLLEEQNINIWDIVQIKTPKTTLEGIVLPRSKYSLPDFIEIKLENNYNLGVHTDEVSEINKVGTREAHYKIPEKQFPYNKKLPPVKLLGTGGTVASRLDYTTGAVIPSFTPGELFSSVPELADICNLDCEIVFEILSENMNYTNWQKLATKIKEAIESGTKGIIIGHGTDTMSYTSAALSFMLKDLSIPVVLTGSQRSSDRPSSDAALNLINSATVATSDIAEVTVVMLGSPSHDYGLIHRGTLVRKMHSSVRDTFRTINNIPLGMVKDNKVQVFQTDYNKRNGKKIELLTNFEPKAALFYYYPGANVEQFDFFIDHNYRGIVIAGTGLGHVGTYLYKS